MPTWNNYVVCSQCLAKRHSREEQCCTHGMAFGLCVECGAPYGGEERPRGHCLGTISLNEGEKAPGVP